MRYSDTELWKISKKDLDQLKRLLSFHDFCEWSIDRLQELIEESTKLENWMDAEVAHLRNYRLKSIRFYQQKAGKC